MGKYFIDPKRSEILSVFPCTMQIALSWPKLLLPFSLRRLEFPALLKSWQKHYERNYRHFVEEDPPGLEATMAFDPQS
jgi:hypothetical protein